MTIRAILPHRRAVAVLVLGAVLLAGFAGFSTPAVGAAVPALTGHLDGVTTVSMGEVRLTGWAADTSALGVSIGVAVYVDGVGHAVTAALARPDVQAYLHAPQSKFGFSTALLIAGGTHAVCAYSLATDGKSNRQLGCRSVTFPVDPIGHIDNVTVDCNWPHGSGTAPLTVTGWQFDPDERGSEGFTAVYTDYGNQGIDSIDYELSSLPRPDVARAYQLPQDRVGFTFVQLAVYATNERFYGVNVAGAGANRFFGDTRHFLYPPGTAVDSYWKRPCTPGTG